MDPLGGDTRDLLALGQPHPAEHGLTPEAREDKTRRHGRRCRITGITILALLYIVCLSLAVASDNGMAASSNSELFYVLAMMAATVTGGLFLMAGLAERREQPVRAMLRQVIAENLAARERQELTIGLVSAVPGRLDALEDTIAKIPGYTEGVIHGVQLRSDAMGSDRD